MTTASEASEEQEFLDGLAAYSAEALSELPTSTLILTLVLATAHDHDGAQAKLAAEVDRRIPVHANTHSPAQAVEP